MLERAPFQQAPLILKLQVQPWCFPHPHATPRTQLVPALGIGARQWHLHGRMLETGRLSWMPEDGAAELALSFATSRRICHREPEGGREWERSGPFQAMPSQGDGGGGSALGLGGWLLWDALPRKTAGGEPSPQGTAPRASFHPHPSSGSQPRASVSPLGLLPRCPLSLLPWEIWCSSHGGCPWSVALLPAPCLRFPVWIRPWGVSGRAGVLAVSALQGDQEGSSAGHPPAGGVSQAWQRCHGNGCPQRQPSPQQSDLAGA